VKRQDARDARTLEEPAKELDEHVSDLLAAAIEVHRILGPGFLESLYEHALCGELGLRNVQISAAGSGERRVQGAPSR